MIIVSAAYTVILQEMFRNAFIRFNSVLGFSYTLVIPLWGLNNNITTRLRFVDAA